MGGNGGVIVEVIPEIEKIVGQQPAAQQLGPTESQNRFNRVFQQFVKAIAREEHPLRIFLDDLQWADSASLKLMELLLTDANSKYLLTIGAYRDNEVSPTHATIQTIEKIQQAETIVNNIVLQPLDWQNVSQLIAETLGETSAAMPSDRTVPLAELLFNKTGGNPFFLTQVLLTLHQEELLTFDFSEGRWLWDIVKIQAIGIADLNVVELVARNIQKLPEVTQKVLKLAACIGYRFNLDVLAIVNEKSLVTTAEELWAALQSGLVLPLNNTYKILLASETTGSANSTQKYDKQVSYKFLHDRVQQAAYSLIPDDEKKLTHLTIGELLLKHTPLSEREEKIFDIVNQLNIGVDFITHQSSKDGLAELNLIAGRKAKASNAYEAAVRYLNVGLELLPPDSWQTHYNLTLALHVEAVAAEYLNINFERANQLFEGVLLRAETLLEKLPVYETKIQFYIAQNKMKEAIETALKILKMMGIKLRKKPNKINILTN